jgi:CubicO group peptidase (beta-lactamase class C family)
MHRLLALAFSASLVLPGAALAAPPPQAPPAPANDAIAKHRLALADDGAAVAVRKDGKICRKVVQTGSRLGGHTDCRTKVEWDELSHNARQDTELHQRTGANGAF